MNVVLILVGLVLLVMGGEALVRGASSLATRMGLSSLVIGLTVVAIATSSPELAVSIGSVLSGDTDLAVGNVVGSNIANVLLILGVGAAVAPLLVVRQVVRLDIPIMIGLSVLMLLLALDGALSVVDGVLLLAVFLGAMVATVVVSRRMAPKAQGPKPTPKDSLWRSVMFVGAGIAGLVAGAQFLVRGAVAIATDLGVSQLVIGLTVVAIGTSLPELAATVVAVRKGETDMAVGNIVGSNVANIGLVLGLPAILGGGLPVQDAAVALDIPLMIATAVLGGALAFTGMRIRRWEGALFVALYVAYVLYLVLNSTGHDALAGFTTIMAGFVLPTLGLIVVLLVANDLRRRRGAKHRDRRVS